VSQPSYRAKRRVPQVIAITFFVLAAYMIDALVVDLPARPHPERSPA